MIGEVIAIGDELTSGRILNSTSQFAAHHLFAIGHEIVAMSTIGDSPELIGAAVRKAIRRADFVIVTGGLGPTSDDLTNEAVSTALGRPTTFYPEILDNINGFLAASGNDFVPKKGSVKLEKLAWLPAGAEVLKPDAHMAGYLLVHDEKPIFFLPGVPHEMKELLVDVVIPKLAQWKSQENRQVRQKLYKIFGISESEVNRRLKHLEEDNSLIRIGYYPVFPEVHLNLTVLGADSSESDALFDLFDERILNTVGHYIYSNGENDLPATVGEMLRTNGKSLAAAESCTGGLLSHKVTTAPGSSDYFSGGIVAYSNEIKANLLHVGADILERYGAVSHQTAEAMAQGVRQACSSDLGVSITGIAGPSGGSDDKPVGTVYFGLATAKNTKTYQFQFSGTRLNIQTLSAFTGLDLVRRKLLEEK